MPFSPRTSATPDVVLVSHFGWLTKVATEKATCFWRSALLAVPPHSMSYVPFCRSGMRLDEFTGTYFTASFARPSLDLSPSTMGAHRSIEKPTGSWLEPRYEKGMDASR